MDGWLDLSMDEWMNGWMGWMNGCTDELMNG